LLDALSHPGTVLQLDPVTTHTAVPEGLSPGMTALLLTLVDSDTPLWLPSGISDAVRQFVRFHCACPLTDDPGRARFLAVPHGFAPPPLAACDQGDPAYPDRSATLLIEVTSLQSGPDNIDGNVQDGNTLTLRGPGIEHTHTLGVLGLPEGFWMQWRANHRHFPLGVDAFFCCETVLCGLPRTTHVEG
jgi:alpha-D-ribose 1-methylphosphonate 5-triphosphate synthase subunit PhnH